MVNIINNPPENWLERLRRGHKVWLVKENKEASIEFAYEHPEPGYRSGRIGVRHGLLDSWFIDIEGRGIDGSQLMLPIEGNLPDNSPELPDVEVRHINRALEKMENRIKYLLDRVAILECRVSPPIDEFDYMNFSKNLPKQIDIEIIPAESTHTQPELPFDKTFGYTYED